MSDAGFTAELMVLGELASGGMGTVELARLRDATGERPVALKRMHPEYARDPEFVGMFKREIWLTGSLDHPNVVGLIGWGEDEGGPYLVMELVDGVSLAVAAINGRRSADRLPERLAAHVAARVAEGLHAAHSLTDSDGRSLEIVHRDVTPSNVLLGFDGSVRVADFGVAKAADGGSRTLTGVIKGKISYMSPEYAARRVADARSDLYSLGVVVYELLSGKLPHSSTSDYELLKLVAYATPPPLAEACPDVDPELARLIGRLMSRAPEGRPGSGEVVAAELDAWLDQRGLERAGLQSELADWAYRNAGGRRTQIRRLLEAGPPTGAEPIALVATDAPARDAAGTLTHTFTFFEHRPAADGRAGTERTESKPKTRRVAVADGPGAPLAGLPSSPLGLPPPSSPIGFASPVSEPGARPSVPSVPPEPLLETGDAPTQPIAKTQRTKRRIVGAVIASSVAVTGVAAIALVVWPASEEEATIPESGAPATAPPAEAEPARPADVQPATGLVLPPTEPPAFAPPLPVGTGTQTVAPPGKVARPAPGAGKKPVSAGKVPNKPTTKPSKPCTPDRFDYPACLSAPR